MQIKEIADSKEWNDLVIANNGIFLQSWQWGEWQEKLGRKIWRFAVEENGQTIGLNLVVKHNLPFNKSYFYSPRGPVFLESRILNLESGILLEKIKELSEQENAIFWRVEPETNDFLSKVNGLGFKVVATRPVQPSKTVILDLTKTEEEFLQEMHPKTRYNIRLAQKHGVKIFQDNKRIDEFLRLLHQTTKRDKFGAYSDDYYRRLFQTADPDFAKLYLAEYEGEILAANLIICFGQTTTYVHGASSDEHRNIMAPHLLHWEIICQAKKQGFNYYDFWGIDEKKWPSLTRFKKNFGGQEISYPGTFDLVLSNLWYRLYRIGKLFKCKM